jgi:hypothetical protein
LVKPPNKNLRPARRPPSAGQRASAKPADSTPSADLARLQVSEEVGLALRHLGVSADLLAEPRPSALFPVDSGLPLLMPQLPMAWLVAQTPAGASDDAHPEARPRKRQKKR